MRANNISALVVKDVVGTEGTLVGMFTECALRCDYANLEKCHATASDGLGYCVMNPANTSNAYASYRGAGKRIH